jgi:hypothetical protein
MHRHNQERNFQCTNCEYSCYEKNELQNHIDAVHLKNTKFTCDVTDCNFKSVKAYQLLVHKKRHEGIKLYKCDILDCKSEFVTRIELTNHKLSHSDEKNFQCSVDDCNSTFKYVFYFNFN